MKNSMRPVIADYGEKDTMTQERIPYRINGDDYVEIHFLLDGEAYDRRHVCARMLKSEEFNDRKCALMLSRVQDGKGEGVYEVGRKSLSQFIEEIRLRRETRRNQGTLILESGDFVTP